MEPSHYFGKLQYQRVATETMTALTTRAGIPSTVLYIHIRYTMFADADHAPNSSVSLMSYPRHTLSVCTSRTEPNASRAARVHPLFPAHPYWRTRNGTMFRASKDGRGSQRLPECYPRRARARCSGRSPRSPQTPVHLASASTSGYTGSARNAPGRSQT